MKIKKTTDKIKLEIDEITVFFSPLTYSQKQEVLTIMNKAHKDNDLMSLNDGITLALRYSLKEIKGLTEEDGSTYQLKIQDGTVTEDCINDILNLSVSSKMQQIAGKLLNGVPEDFAIEGVTYSKND